ncbi:hypothetical protein CcaverHIS002_0108510 [Cutaneotrichosporon cavernicola]|nr:hypothetical protein CcaverHIS002_0108510 [Cutaneotrichosporon cavernicola]
MIRRPLGTRYGAIWAGVFGVVVFSLFIYVGHHFSDSSTDMSRWRSAITAITNLGGGSGSAYDALVLVPDPQGDANWSVSDNYKWYTDSKLRELTACMARGNCPKNADKVVINNVWHCHNAFFGNYLGGEGTWCNSMHRSLERQGYTVLYTYYDWEYVDHIHRQIPDLIKVIFADDDDQNSKTLPFMKSEKNPHGIPAWKMFRFSYYSSYAGTIIGTPWVVTCEPEWRDPDHGPRNFTYLGYDMEPDAAHISVIPWEERPYRAYVLGKHITFFHKDRARVAWERDFYKRARDQIRKKFPSFEFVSSFKDERSEEEQKNEGPMTVPDGIRNLARLNPVEFDHDLSTSRLLVGIGWPTSSPSPYRALARGVPFLSPYKAHVDAKDPTDPYEWTDSQHDALRREKPPLVYNVPEFDYDSFVKAIETAMESPIEGHIYPRMTRPAFDERMRYLMETDWRAEAARILKLRKAGNETQNNGNVGIFEL